MYPNVFFYEYNDIALETITLSVDWACNGMIKTALCFICTVVCVYVCVCTDLNASEDSMGVYSVLGAAAVHHGRARVALITSCMTV